MLPALSNLAGDRAGRRRLMSGARGTAGGFTLVELVVALALAGLLTGLAAPAAFRMYATMQYRDAVRGVQAAAVGARLRALTAGRPIDLMVEPEAHRYAVQPAGNRYDRGQAVSFRDSLLVNVDSARQLISERGVAVIRFYPDGSSSGGSVTLRRESGEGVRLRVDWLLGRVTQEEPERL